MNANAEKWVAALESGEYQQTTGALRRGDSFCCLGVACDLAVKEGVIPPPRVDEDYCAYGNNRESGVLPHEVRLWLGLSSQTGDYGERWEHWLSGDNDSGASFAEIAQTIRTHPELFVDAES